MEKVKILVQVRFHFDLVDFTSLAKGRASFKACCPTFSPCVMCVCVFSTCHVVFVVLSNSQVCFIPTPIVLLRSRHFCDDRGQRNRSGLNDVSVGINDRMQVFSIFRT
jgi:hypothetical protein